MKRILNTWLNKSTKPQSYTKLWNLNNIRKKQDLLKTSRENEPEISIVSDYQQHRELENNCLFSNQELT